MLRGVEFGESIPHRPERGCEGIAFLLEFCGGRSDESLQAVVSKCELGHTLDV